MSPQDSRFDLVIRGGRVIDPARGLDARLDVGIVDGRVASLEPELPAAAREVDARGCLVLPGLIDLHAHVFWGYGDKADPDRDVLRHGTTTVVDAGTAGCLAIEGFRRYVVERATTRVLAFLNVSSIGQIDLRIGELHNRSYLDEPAAVEAVKANRDIVRGIKVRLSDYVCGGFSRLVLEASIRVAEQAGVPVMAHIGDTSEPLAHLLPLFRHGDIVTHSFSGRRHNLFDRQGRVLEEARAARERGVVFDGASGRSHFSSAIAERLLEQDFLPDTIATDVSAATAGKLTLPVMMSRLLAVGVDLERIVPMVTSNPARTLNEPSWGTLAVGGEADVSVLELVNEPWPFVDVDGDERCGARYVRAKETVRAGQVVA